MTENNSTPNGILGAMIKCAEGTYDLMADYYENLPTPPSQTKEARRKYSAMYRKKNPERIRARSMNDRARTVSSSDNARNIREMYEAMEGRCGYCGIPVFWDIPYDVHIDHITPLSRGGHNRPANLIISCETCNASKHDKSLDDWKDERKW